MFDLRDLYQEVIVDHNRSPRNFRDMDDATDTADGYNPLCGDRLTLYLKVNNEGMIEDASFQGEGCAISTASASLMTEKLKGLPAIEAEHFFEMFKRMATSAVGSAVDEAELGKLAVLSGVREFPARIKCATLCWHTLHAALMRDNQTAKTE
ncbi:MAG: SUF system NifU family Fe-S cluster assembly protein [Mariprofundaceae bacterium]